jgi:hypothetical protein
MLGHEIYMLNQLGPKQHYFLNLFIVIIAMFFIILSIFSYFFKNTIIP